MPFRDRFERLDPDVWTEAYLPAWSSRAQAASLGFTPHHGSVAVTCAAELSTRSMFSAWMVGLEDRPGRSGETAWSRCSGTARAGDGWPSARACTRSATPPSGTTSRRPLMLVLAVFDVPDEPGPSDHVPRLRVSEVVGS